MSLVLDASMALAWCMTRNDPSEAAIARDALNVVRQSKTPVPALWFTEILNTVLVFERAGRLSLRDSADFLSDLGTLWIDQDPVPVEESWERVLTAGRIYRLTAYNATYLELALRTASMLATFDQQLAAAARLSGVPVFGDRS